MSGSIGNGFPGKQNTIADAQRIISLSEELFVSGKSFSSRGYFDLGNGASPANLKYIVFDPTSCPASQILFEPLKFKGVKAGPVLIDIFINPTLAAGGRTSIPGVNRRVSSPLPLCTFEFIVPANVTNEGTKIPSSRFIGSESSVGRSSESDESAGGLPFEVSGSTVYLIKFENTDSEDSLIEYNVTWYEN